MPTYIRYKKFFYKKSKASPLQEKCYCYKLQPEEDHQITKIPFRDFKWIGPNVVEKILPLETEQSAKLPLTKSKV